MACGGWGHTVQWALATELRAANWVTKHLAPAEGVAPLQLHVADHGMLLSPLPSLGLQSGQAAPLAAGAAGLTLGMRKLVVLRAPRLAAQHPSVHDAVATSLSSLAGCTASINLQLLQRGGPAGSSRHDQQPLVGIAPAAGAGTAAAAAAAAATGTGSVPAPPDRGKQAAIKEAASASTGADGTGAARPAYADGSDNPCGSLEAATASAAESNILSSYWSSWFSSPAKPPPSHSASPRAVEARAPGTGLPTDVDQHAASGAGPPTGSDTQPVAAPAGATAEAGGEPNTVAGFLGQLEQRLAPLLPSVGVVHLGLEQASKDGPVLLWRQQLEAVAEPSE